MDTYEKIALLEETADTCILLRRACTALSDKTKDKRLIKRSEQELVKDLNEQIAKLMIDLSELVDAGIISNESIESVIMSKEKQINL